MARPTKLTPEIATGIVTLIQHGVHPPIAAGAYGVAYATYYEWIARGEGREERRLAEPIYIEFADAVSRAEQQAESALVHLAVQKVKTTGDAVMLLERRFGERWRNRSEMTINLRREAEKLAAETGLSADEILAEAERIFSEARTRT